MDFEQNTIEATTVTTEAAGGDGVSVPSPEVVTSTEAAEGEVVSGPTDDRSVTPEVPNGPVGEVVNEVEVPATSGVVANLFFRGVLVVTLESDTEDDEYVP